VDAPDALETIPSGASLNHTLWSLYADEAPAEKVGRQWLERMAWATRRAMAWRGARQVAGQRLTDVLYRDAIAQPMREVERVQRASGLELIPEARSAMERWLAGSERPAHPPHRYAPETFGLSEATIREAFADYLGWMGASGVGGG
jgi:hypothetical protein